MQTIRIYYRVIGGRDTLTRSRAERSAARDRRRRQLGERLGQQQRRPLHRRPLDHAERGSRRPAVVTFTRLAELHGSAG